MTRPILVIDLDACLGCHACATVCKQENDIAIGSTWNRVLEIGPTGKFPNLEMYYLPLLCQQCENPTCVAVCPTGASFRRADGVVLVNHQRCLGCQYCVVACPYGVRHYDHEAGLIEKCTLCAHRGADQGDPPCVRACPAQCRIYGDLDDPNSEVSIALRAAGDNVHHLVDIGNGPSVAYIMHNHTWRSG